MEDGAPLGFPKGGGYPEPQGEYYCGVGYKNVGSIGREIVDTHLELCLYAGINHEGINAEVASGQWEFQVFGKGSKTAADQIWVARFLLLRLCEEYGIDVEWHCKPLKGDNDQRLTGLHETQSIDMFSWGVADRGASIRVPHSFVKDDAYKGYLEDRRPNSQGDPYQIASRVIKTIQSVPTA